MLIWLRIHMVSAVQFSSHWVDLLVFPNGPSGPGLTVWSVGDRETVWFETVSTSSSYFDIHCSDSNGPSGPGSDQHTFSICGNLSLGPMDCLVQVWSAASAACVSMLPDFPACKMIIIYENSTVFVL